MNLKDAFLDFLETMKKAPKTCPTSQLTWWATLGAKIMILTDAMVEHNEIADKAANEITSLRAQIAIKDADIQSLRAELEKANEDAAGRAWNALSPAEREQAIRGAV